MLLLKSSMIFVFLNSSQVNQYSLWPNSDSWHLKHFHPLVCHTVFVFYHTVIGFSIESLGGALKSSWPFNVGMPQRKNTLDLFTICSLHPVSCFQTPCFGPFHYLQSPPSFLFSNTMLGSQNICPRLFLRTGLFPYVYIYTHTHTHNTSLSSLFHVYA